MNPDRQILGAEDGLAVVNEALAYYGQTLLHNPDHQPFPQRTGL